MKLDEENRPPLMNVNAPNSNYRNVLNKAVVSHDYSPAGDYVYYVRKNQSGGFGFLGGAGVGKTIRRIKLSDNSQETVTIPSYTMLEAVNNSYIRRAHDDKMYYQRVMFEAPWLPTESELKQINDPDDVLANLTFGTLDLQSGHNELGLPLQPFVLYELRTKVPSEPIKAERLLAMRYYELTDHLGNVLAVISDVRLGQDDKTYSAGSYSAGSDNIVDYYKVTVESATDYYPFGMLMPGRHFTSAAYRFGFNGQEKVDEIKGSGNHYTAEYWEYDPRIGRRWNVDPMSFKYAWQSPNVAFNNNPIRYSDPRGLEGEDEVAPASHTKSTSATGSNLYLPTSASTTTFSGSTTKGKTTGNTYNVTEGGVSSFTIGEGDNAKTYNAMFNTKSGDFTGYKTSSGEVYNNPAGLKTEGTVAKVGFGETRGLYPSSDGSKVGANPANWDYQMSQQLMEARAAIEVVSARNTQTHPGATPSSKTAENQQRQFAISENFPAVQSAILNDPNVKYFYLSSSPTSNHAGLSYKYNDITLVKSYGPFYNAGSGGDAKGTAIYINFYSATPKKN